MYCTFVLYKLYVCTYVCMYVCTVCTVCTYVSMYVCTVRTVHMSESLMVTVRTVCTVRMCSMYCMYCVYEWTMNGWTINGHILSDSAFPVPCAELLRLGQIKYTFNLVMFLVASRIIYLRFETARIFWAKLTSFCMRMLASVGLNVPQLMVGN